MIRKNFGGNGADRDRTGDPLLAKQVLSQLSYRPHGNNETKLASPSAHPNSDSAPLLESLQVRVSRRILFW
jgi:hypothetical protein